jgi:hypothetical protein
MNNSKALSRIIQQAITKNAQFKKGTIVSSPIKQSVDGGEWIWAADVYIGQGIILEKVPIAINNRSIGYADVGRPVTLQRMTTGAWSVAGLSKVITSNTHTIYMSFMDDIAARVADEYSDTIRQLTYGELGTYGGYGVLKYGTWGMFKSDGSLQKILGD